MIQTQEAPTFAGFDPAHTTSVPDALFDELLAVLSGPEFKVLCYVTRRTRGFSKEWDAISLTQFTNGITTKDGRVLDRGCGVTVRSRVIKILETLEERGYIEIKKSEIKTGIIYYRLRYASVVSDTSASVECDTSLNGTSVENDTTSSVECDTSASVVFDTHKKQLTRNSKQDSITDAVASTPTQNVDAQTEPLSPPKKRTYKPAKPKQTEDEKQRIAGVYAFFDKLGQEASGESDFTYTPSKKANEAIKAWLKSKPTQEVLREVFFELWNMPPDPRTSFEWKKNMHIHSVLGQYSTRRMAIEARRKKQTSRATETVVRYEEEDDMPYLPPQSLRKLSVAR